ncbi:MAG: Crp/Fnr family transcriptional regulator [Steroidobacteraceae bacterium]|nr:Crp/Fnr family transcriptional regulator [Steroidobacteraceae bacterium]
MEQAASVSMDANNLLLKGLGARDRRKLLSAGEPVTLRVGDALSESGRRMSHVFFPIDSAASLIVNGTGHSALEVGLVGREGMLGVPLILGASNAAFHSVVQIEGRAWRMDAAHFTRQLDENPALRKRMNRYAHVRLVQIAGNIACKSSHRVEGRLARWLLMSRDRANSNALALTHESLSRLLGVRRAGVTLAASALRRRNLIRYARGHIELLDPRGLASVACPCYASDKATYARFMD